MKITTTGPKAPEKVSIADIPVGETFVWPGEEPNAYLGGPFMRIWSESSHYRYVRLGNGHTWTGRTDGDRYTRKQLLRVEAEVIYNEEKS